MAEVKPSVTIIANRLASFGGGERWVCEAASRLKTHLDINIINPVSDRDSVRMDESKLGKAYKLGKAMITDIRCLGISSKMPGIGSFTMLIPSFSALATLSDAIRKSDVIYEISFNPLLLFWALFFSKMHGKRFILGMHNPDFLVGQSDRDRASAFGADLNRFIQKTILAFVDEVHVQTETQGKALAANGYNKAFYYIPHFLYLKADFKRSDRRRKFVALFAGRQEVYQKGLDLLKEIVRKTLSRNNKIQFHIVGSGEDGESIGMKLAMAYPRNVKRMGFLPERRLIEEYRNCSVFVLSSRYETPGLTLLEAQDYGLPAVAFDVPGPADIIKTDFQGKLIEPFNTEKFASGILNYYKLYMEDAEAYLKMRKRIHETVTERYSTERFVKAFVGMIKNDI